MTLCHVCWRRRGGDRAIEDEVDRPWVIAKDGMRLVVGSIWRGTTGGGAKACSTIEEEAVVRDDR
jgi:hypothetical protein